MKPDPYDPRPRTSYLSWDDYFMSVAFLSAQRSKDPNKQARTAPSVPAVERAPKPALLDAPTGCETAAAAGYLSRRPARFCA